MVAAMVVAMATPVLAGETVEILSAKDNTLIQTEDGSTSNGMGDSVYCGRVGPLGDGTFRRAVIAFDIASNGPAGATVTSVDLTLTLAQAASGNEEHVLHPLLQDWGEGKSISSGGRGAPAEEDDATWLHTFFDDMFWDNPGGDFGPPSATTTVGFAPGEYTWVSNDALVADVQGWVDDVSTNYGWIMIGNEEQMFTAKRFFSRDLDEESLRPRLTVTYEVDDECPGDVDGSGDVGFPDLLAVLAAWGPCEDCPEDLDGSGDVGFGDLLIVLAAWGPCK